MPMMVRTMPATAMSGTRSPRKKNPSGSAKMGAVDESTVATATPAYWTPATNRIELAVLSAPSAKSRQSPAGGGVSDWLGH